jgi:hypothetical protein
LTFTFEKKPTEEPPSNSGNNLIPPVAPKANFSAWAEILIFSSAEARLLCDTFLEAFKLLVAELSSSEPVLGV